MAEIVPFSGIYYNPEKSSKIGDLICPSTDYLNEEWIIKLKENGNNFCNAIYSEGEGTGKYRSSIHKLYGWLLRDVLVEDKTPTLYIIEQNVMLTGVEYKRYGIIGLLRIDDYDGKIKKVEKTNEKYRDDKFSLIKETQFNLEPVIGLVNDSSNSLELLLTPKKDGTVKSLLNFSDMNGNLNIIYRIDVPDLRDEIIRYLSDKVLYIIDNNRYEAALKYKNEAASMLKERISGKEPFNYVLVNLFNAYDKGMRINPVSRLIKGLKMKPADLIKELSQKYKLSAIPFSDQNTEKLAERKLRMILNDSLTSGGISYGILLKAIPGKYLILNMSMSLSKDMIDTEVLESMIFSPLLGIKDVKNDASVGYAYSDSDAYRSVSEGQFEAAFLTNEIKAAKLFDLADNGKLIPYNSISLYPRVMSGGMSFSYKYSKISL